MQGAQSLRSKWPVGTKAVAISPSDLCAFGGAQDFSPQCVRATPSPTGAPPALSWPLSPFRPEGPREEGSRVWVPLL